MEAVRQAAQGMREVAPQRLNAEQKLAVASVLCGAGVGAPFTLFGPPGTGVQSQPCLTLGPVLALLCVSERGRGRGKGRRGQRQQESASMYAC